MSLVNISQDGSSNAYNVTMTDGRGVGKFNLDNVPEATNQDRLNAINLCALKQLSQQFVPTDGEENAITRLINECDLNQRTCESNLQQVSAAKTKLTGLKTIQQRVQTIANQANKNIKTAYQAHNTFTQLETTKLEQKTEEARAFEAYQRQEKTFIRTMQDTTTKIKEKESEIITSVVARDTRAANAMAQKEKLELLSVAIQSATDGTVAELMAKLDTTELKQNIAMMSSFGETAQAASEQEGHAEPPRFNPRAVEQSAASPPNRRLVVIAKQLAPQQALSELAKMDKAIAAL